MAWEPVLFWAGVTLTLLLAVWVLYRAILRDRPRGRPRCPNCWYDMTGAPSLTCPECGQDARTPARLLKTRRRWRLAVLALLIALLPLYGHMVRERMIVQSESLKSALVPTTARIVLMRWMEEGNHQVLDGRLPSVWGDPHLRWRPMRWQMWLLTREAIREVRAQQHPPAGPFLYWLVLAARELDGPLRELADLAATHPGPGVRHHVMDCFLVIPARPALDRCLVDLAGRLENADDRRALYRVITIEFPHVLREFSDDLLVSYLQVLQNPLSSTMPDPLIRECLRRGEPRLIAAVRVPITPWLGVFPPDGSCHSLTSLIALRQWEGKPPPATLVIDEGTTLRGRVGALPTITVGVVNSDVDREPFWVEVGGDSRGRRHKYSIELAGGTRSSVQQIGMNRGGLLGGPPRLTFGERSESAVLDLNEYIFIDRPGIYRGRIVHHHQTGLLDLPPAVREQLYVVESAEIELIVEP